MDKDHYIVEGVDVRREGRMFTFYLGICKYQREQHKNETLDSILDMAKKTIVMERARGIDESVSRFAARQ